MSYYDEQAWIRGNMRAMRQMPKHWHIEDADSAWDKVRVICWLIVKTLVVAAGVITLYAVARGMP